MPEWKISTEPVPYPEAHAWMEQRVAAMHEGIAGEVVWFLEHPSLYTAGTSAAPEELKDKTSFPVYDAGRGGRYTYHGPGQRVAYVLCDLHRRDKDVRAHVWRLEEWVIRTVQHFDVLAERRAGRIGLWVAVGDTEKKIAAIGVRVRHSITFHGLAINVNPDLSHFNGIVPCGIQDYGVTSLADLGGDVTMEELDAAMKKEWPEIFGDLISE
jgi:lipoyl(octanoyl) transferase